MTAPPRRPVPRGAGLYYRRLDPRGARAAARRCADHGLSHVALASVWLEGGHTRDLVASAIEEEYAAAFREVGLDVWIWGYPDAGLEREFVWAIMEHVWRLDAVGPLLDVEKSYRRNLTAAEQLIDATLDALDERHSFGATYYGSPRMFASELRRLLAGVAWVSPQVYTVEPWVARKLLEDWRELGAEHLVASVPTYGPQSGGNLGAYLGAIEDLVEGVIAWSANSVDDIEWRTLERWASRFGARAA